MEKSVHIIKRKNNPLVSVIIPSLDGYRGGNVPKLLEDLNKQTFSRMEFAQEDSRRDPESVLPEPLHSGQDFEVLIVKGESPCARSHNLGVQSASGKIVVFFDDDIILGNNKIIDNLIKPLIKDKSIGISGASQLIPPDANRFQKKCSREFDRFEFPLVSEMVESDMATHAAMAIRKEVFIEVGQENEKLIYGDDPDLRYRVRQAGYKIVVIPDTWIYHPPPKDLSSFLRIAFQRGKGAAQDFRHYPDLIYETPPANATIFVPRRTFLYRALRFFSQNIEAIINLKLIFLSVRISYGLGYLTGLSKEMLRI